MEGNVNDKLSALTQQKNILSNQDLKPNIFEADDFKNETTEFGRCNNISGIL